MKKIGFTLLDQFDHDRSEQRDVYDNMWIKLLEKINCVPYPIPNGLKNPEIWLEKTELDGFVFTGGNDLSKLKNSRNSSKRRDDLEFLIIEHCINKKIPLIGVCRGMQILNYFFKGSITQIKNHVKTNHDIFFNYRNEIIKRRVNSFHNWGIKENDLSV